MMSLITLDEAVNERIRVCVDKIGQEYHPSVRPIYGSVNGLRPELIGSCILLSVNGVKFVVTAAHITDWSSSHALYVAGTIRTEPVQMLGEIHFTRKPLKGRNHDKYDIAFWKISSSCEHELGAVKFIEQKQIFLQQNITDK